jgi:FlaA1/EpsC-like NDP-sugar epimerase
MQYMRKLPIILADVGLIAAAFTLSFLFRFDFHLPAEMRPLYWQGLCVILLIKPLIFCFSGLYRSLWQYASLHDAVNIFRVVSIASLSATFVIALARHFAPFPRSIIVMDWILLMFLVAASRVGLRAYREISRPARNDRKRRTLMIGAGEAGSLLLKEIRRQAGSTFDVVCIVDDDAAKKGMKLNGIPVLGTQEDLPSLVVDLGIEEIIIAIPSARGKTLRAIVDNCKKTGVRFRTLPAFGDIMDGKVSVSQIRDVEIHDLLGREPVEIDEAGIFGYLTTRKVLVSGAAGSIGSEICRQVARFRPGKLILLDNAETPLFYLERELAERFPDLEIIPLVSDIRNRGKIDAIFNEFRPDAVFHAAAYKHVPMMEDHPEEAVTNNVGGTCIMADAAHRVGVRNFVLVSTDKAVNPTSVMGATKRVAEIYVQALAARSSTRFTTVRFGNVLGSNGSVIPLFMEQIKKGGPVTVTDPEVVRYFMTIPEATRLVLQAGCLGKGGEIFVLDMGEPVRIKDLAEELIKLSGFTPYEDIDIVYSGLRPGEKLFEELLIEGEGIMPTSHGKIRVAAAVEADLAVVSTELAQLLRHAEKADIMGIKNSLCMLIMEFTPSSRFSCQALLSQQRPLRDHLPKQNHAAVTAKILPLRSNVKGHGLTANSH